MCKPDLTRYRLHSTYLLMVMVFIHTMSVGQECMRGNCEDGKGLIVFESGDMYEGGFQNGKRHGTGIYKWADGKKYEGSFNMGSIEGMGIFKWPSGNRYVGNYKDNKFEGQGLFIWKSGKTYEGNFKNAKKEGFGVLIEQDGTQYEGAFREDLKHGTGTLILASGDRYEGEFKQDVMEGEGLYASVAGDQYRGQFQQGKPHGQGMMIYANGNIFNGEFQNGAETEDGILHLAGSDSIESKIQIRQIGIEVDPNASLEELRYQYVTQLKREGESIVKSKILDYSTRRKWVQAYVHLNKGAQYTFAILGDPKTYRLSFSIDNQGYQGEWIRSQSTLVTGTFTPYVSGNYPFKIEAHPIDKTTVALELNYIISKL